MLGTLEDVTRHKSTRKDETLPNRIQHPQDHLLRGKQKEQRYPSTNIELVNMEDIIPIFILVLLMCDIDNLKAQLELVLDFIDYDQCDLES